MNFTEIPSFLPFFVDFKKFRNELILNFAREVVGNFSKFQHIFKNLIIIKYLILNKKNI